MTAATDRVLFGVDSGGRRLVVAAPARLSSWWPQIARHVPGGSAHLTRLTEGRSDLVVPDTAEPGDVRRLINAHLHRLHLDHGTLCVHACALDRGPGTGAVVLLGGHGAGKTLAATALARDGWDVLAGDTVLLDVARDGALSVRGGTRAFLARPRPLQRWFPDLAPAAGAPVPVEPDRVDLGPAVKYRVPEPVPVAAAVLVDVDGDPDAADGVAEQLDWGTCATLWLRASGHLVDRVLHGSYAVLREVEDAEALRHRLTLARAAADAVPVQAVWGSPSGIASRAARLATTPRPEEVQS